MERQTTSESLEQAASDLRKALEVSKAEAQLLREELGDIQNMSVLEETKFRDEHRRLETERVQSIKRTEELEQEIEECNVAHAKEIERIKNGHALHVDNVRRNAEAAVRKAGEIVEKQRKDKEKLQSELESMEQAFSAEKDELSDLRNEILVANDRVEDVERHRDALRDELSSTHESLEQAVRECESAKKDLDLTKKELLSLQADYEQINEMTAKRISEVVRSKERNWQRKMDELKTELDLRSKLLMIEWGRKEIGAGDPQGYRYKCLD
jgi:myosin protein heavy chain